MRREEYISDDMVVKRANAAIRLELEKKKAMDIPVIVYDRETQAVYQEHSEGKRMRKGRYSERVAKKA